MGEQHIYTGPSLAGGALGVLAPLPFWNLDSPLFSGQRGIRQSRIIKVNSVQEACAKCFAVHILKFEILQTA